MTALRSVDGEMLYSGCQSTVVVTGGYEAGADVHNDDLQGSCRDGGRDGRVGLWTF